MIDIEKFICSLIHKSSRLSAIYVINIIEALHYQGLDYKDGKLVRITPELKENGDEMIKKEITELVMQPTWKTEKEFHRRKELCAWIEKQGEKNSALHIPKFKVGDVMRTLQEAADNITDGLPVVVSIDGKYYRCNNEIIDIKDQDNYEYPPMNRNHDICDSCDKQKPAWSEEDELRMNTVCKLLDGLDLQQNWLKSLKDRVQPQNSWKPSERQMEVLAWCKPLFADPKAIGILESLINDLKKLREE